MIFDSIAKMLAEQFEVSAANITMETSLVDDLGADSLDVVELIVSVEDEFGLSISDEDAVELTTVGKIVEYIEGLR